MSASEITRGRFVKCLRGPYKGVVGKVKSVHRGGTVPDVPDDVVATAADPAARLQCYKAMAGGHVETAHHVGVKVSQIAACAAPKPPAGRKPPAEALPPLKGKSDARVAAEAISDARKAVRRRKDAP